MNTDSRGWTRICAAGIERFKPKNAGQWAQDCLRRLFLSVSIRGYPRSSVLRWSVALSFAAVAPSAIAAEAPPGASACSGCHATNASVATPVPRLAGRKPADIIAALAAFKNGQRPATVMDRIAKGFTDDEIRAIAEWYGAMPGDGG
jgi:cytochrome c553